MGILGSLLVVVGLSALSTGAVAAMSAQGEEFPTRPIRWLIAYPPGGVSDLLGRAIGEQLGRVLGKQIVVDNRPGASGIVAAEIAARSQPDGYTLMMGETSTHAVNAELFRKLPYDPVSSFSPVTLLAETPLVLLRGAGMRASTVADIIAAARSGSAPLSYGTGGIGTSTHLTAELFKSAVRIELLHVPYKGSPFVIADLMQGRIDISFINLPPVMGQIEAGRLTPIAVTSEARLTHLPQVPTIAETIPGFAATTWYGAFVPKNTARARIAVLNTAIASAVKDRALRDRLASLGFELRTTSPEELGNFQGMEIRKWRKVIQEQNIRVQ